MKPILAASLAVASLAGPAAARARAVQVAHARPLTGWVPGTAYPVGSGGGRAICPRMPLQATGRH